MNRQVADKLTLLSPRQREILVTLADGTPTYPAVADRLGMSRHTVRTHVTNIMLRLNIHSKSELVAFAIRSGLA